MLGFFIPFSYEEWLVSIKGEPGKDGHTPEITIGENGNWFVDGVDTGVSAQGSTSKDHNGTEGLEFYPINDTECAVAVGTAKFLHEIVIPSTYKNYTVTTILGGDESNAGFVGCSSLTSIEFEDTTDWYRVGNKTYWENKENGTLITYPQDFGIIEFVWSNYNSGCYWYKK